MNRILLIIPVITIGILSSTLYADAWWWDTPEDEPIREPQTIIKDTKVHSQFYDYNGNYYEWVTPIATYEGLVIRSNFISYLGEKAGSGYNPNSFWSTLKDKIISAPTDLAGIDTVELYLNGYMYRYQDFTQFSTRSFTNVIDDVYHNSENNAEFIVNVWYIVSQLTVYDVDVNAQSEGRYPLETLIRTGGDCEDLSILIADMLRSSKYTKDWTIQLVYMDSDNPQDPQTLNHVVVYVYDGEYEYVIESTGSPDEYWNYYSNIDGWYFDV